jgi:hypothetical protein
MRMTGDDDAVWGVVAEEGEAGMETVVEAFDLD